MLVVELSDGIVGEALVSPQTAKHFIEINRAEVRHILYLPYDCKPMVDFRSQRSKNSRQLSRPEFHHSGTTAAFVLRRLADVGDMWMAFQKLTKRLA
jgi:hypothetical protein